MNKFPKLTSIFLPDDTKEVQQEDEQQTDDWIILSTDLREPLLED